MSTARNRSPLIRILLLLRDDWSTLTRIALVALLGALVALIAPFLSKYLLDTVFPAADVRLLTVFAAGYVVATLSSAALQGLRELWVTKFATRCTSSINLLLYNHVQHLPAHYFWARATGDITSRIVEARNAVTVVISSTLQVLSQLALVVLVPPIIFVLNWRLGIAAMISAPWVPVASYIGGRIARSRWKRSVTAAAKSNALQVEALTQVHMIQSTALEPWMFRRLQGDLLEAYHARMDVARFSFGANIAVQVLQTVTSAALLWYSGWLIIHNVITVGSYFAFASCLGYFIMPLSQLANLFTSTQEAYANLDRFFELLDAEPEQDPRQVEASIGPVRWRIRGHFRGTDLTFGYGETALIRNLTLEIRPGEPLAIMGPSGVGKSTLFRLITRSVAPHSGRLTCDGVDVRKIPLRDYRRQIGVVWQDMPLLRGTLLDNLCPGSATPDMREVEAVIDLCQARDVLDACEQGYATIVGERGATLSGGQRQRIALARAILSRAPVLLLDEATSQLDYDTERRVLDALLHYCRDRAIAFISHRPLVADLAAARLTVGRPLHDNVDNAVDAHEAWPAWHGATRGSGTQKTARKL